MDDLAARAASTGVPLAPPIDVWGLAERHGARVVERPLMWGEGRLVHRRDCVEIHVSTRSSPARRRFTIAHELGHLWALREGVGLSLAAPVQEERFCNAFAAALLIPRDWLEIHGNGRAEGLPALCRLARLAQTSLSAMLIRLRSQLGWRGILLHCRREPEGWQLASVTGADSRLERRLSIAPETALALSALDTGAGIIRLRLPLALDDQLVGCSVDLSLARRSALAFTRLRIPRPDAEAREGRRPPIPSSGVRAPEKTIDSVPFVPALPRLPLPAGLATSQKGWRIWALTRGLSAAPLPPKLPLPGAMVQPSGRLGLGGGFISPRHLSL